MNQHAHDEDHLHHTSLTDIMLIERIAVGDRTALGSLYDRYAALLYTLALRITSSRASAEVVVEEVFGLCWEAGKGFLQSSPSATLIAVTRQYARQVAGAANTHTAREAIRAKLFVPGLHHELTLDNAAIIRLRAALSALPAEQRDVIELSYYAGLRQNEIAERLLLPKPSVMCALRLGLQALATSVTSAVDLPATGVSVPFPAHYAAADQHNE
jgi:RNA polymerase sigma-70 factor (ECF subfamily)